MAVTALVSSTAVDHIAACGVPLDLLPYGWDPPPQITIPVLLMIGATIVLMWRSYRVMDSKLSRYASTPRTQAQLPPEVKAVYDEARARATPEPVDAPKIAQELGPQVPDRYRGNLVRLIYFSAGCAQGMDPRDAVHYAERTVSGLTGQPPPSSSA